MVMESPHRDMSWHYFESHVTLEPFLDDKTKEGSFNHICARHGFRPAGLFLQKRKDDTPERSRFDAFCTSRDTSYSPLWERTVHLLDSLREQGFMVWRYKIESVVLDSRYDDSRYPLQRVTIPEKEPQDGEQ